jgi:hypothetical protein
MALNAANPNYSHSKRAHQSSRVRIAVVIMLRSDRIDGLGPGLLVHDERKSDIVSARPRPSRITLSAALLVVASAQEYRKKCRGSNPYPASRYGRQLDMLGAKPDAD